MEAENVSFLPVLAQLPSFLTAEKVCPFPPLTLAGGGSSPLHFLTVRDPRSSGHCMRPDTWSLPEFQVFADARKAFLKALTWYPLLSLLIS